LGGEEGGAKREGEEGGREKTFGSHTTLSRHVDIGEKKGGEEKGEQGGKGKKGDGKFFCHVIVIRIKKWRRGSGKKGGNTIFFHHIVA